jgi:hypothetical protein
MLNQPAAEVNHKLKNLKSYIFLSYIGIFFMIFSHNMIKLVFFSWKSLENDENAVFAILATKILLNELSMIFIPSHGLQLLQYSYIFKPTHYDS